MVTNTQYSITARRYTNNKYDSDVVFRMETDRSGEVEIAFVGLDEECQAEAYQLMRASLALLKQPPLQPTTETEQAKELTDA